MNVLVLDFETFFSDDYTLSKMTTEAYVRDPRFEAHGVGVWHTNANNGELLAPYWLDAHEMHHLIETQDWKNTAVLCHHAQFDGLILNHRYGVKPALWLDTLSMARYVLGTRSRLGLDRLAEHYGLKRKTIDYSAETGFKGHHWRDMPQLMRDNLSSGCLDDLEITWGLFNKLMEDFPRCELPIVDLTVRMFTEPKLVGDAPLFEKIRDQEFLSKNETLYALGVGEKDLASNDKFAALLESLGVEVEQKFSPPNKTYPQGRYIPAVAKSDQFMRDLEDNPDEQIAALARARIEVRSTLEETRAGRMASCGRRGAVPVYLHYSGADTRRWSGGDAINLQNLPRGGGLRQGLRAPEGFLFAAPDQSQGECRILNWLAGQASVVERFARNEDPYLPMASAFYGREITKADKDERQMGKGLELGCGFGMGHAKLKITLARAKPKSIVVSAEEAERGVNVYRSTHPAVVALWREAGDVLRKLANKQEFDWRILHGVGGRLYHPNGNWLDYTTLEWHADEETGDRFWRLKTRSGWKKMYGAKLVENVVQWLSRIVTSEAMVKFRDYGYPVVGMSHDDVWLLVPQDDDASHESVIVQIMAAPPSWAPGLPLGAECKIGETYS